MTARTSAAAAIATLAPGSRVIASPSCATPETLLRALAAHAETAPGIELSAALLLGTLPFRDAVAAGTLRYRTWHVPAGARDLMRAGLVEYVPLRGFDVPGYVAASEYDAVLVRVAPPTDDGTVSLGCSASYTKAAMAGARTVIAEVDEQMPRTLGDDATVSLDDIDYLVDAETDTCLYTSAPGEDVSNRIAEHIAELLPRAATLQIGIGAIPEALAGKLADANVGALHAVGLTIDQHVRLFESGRLSKAERPAVYAVEVMGTREVLDFVDRNPAIEMISSTRCHDPRWLSTLRRFVSVNTAIEIDLDGQVASETVRGETIAAVGGSFDFFEGASWSTGGLRVLALASTTVDGRISKVVPRLAEGTPVTIPRHSVDVVVTEYGVARLAGKSRRERAEALTAVAAPQFRDALADH